MATAKLERRCINCIYFDPSSEADRGLCRQRPPGAVSGWPKVLAFEWCGSHVLSTPLPTPDKSHLKALK